MALSDIASTLVSEMPQPSQHAIEAEMGSNKVEETHQDETPKKKRGRPAGQPSKPKSIVGVQQPSKNSAQNTAVGHGLADTFLSVAQMVGGEEWKPEDAERLVIRDAFGKYAESKNLSDVPPGLVLVTVIIAYAAPRFARPLTMSKTKRFTNWISSKFGRKNAAHVNTGNDGIGKNESSQTISG